MTTPNRQRLLSFFFLVCLTILSSGWTLGVRADDWGPQLNPPRRINYDPLWEDDFSKDFDPDEIDRAVLSDRLAARSGSARHLSQAASPRRTTRPVGFDARLEPSDSILPSRFLEESDGKATAPKPLKKTDHPGNLQVDDTIVPTLSNHSEIVSFDQELIVGDGMIVGASGIEQVGASYGGLYNECSPALDSCFLGPPIVKSFGCGILDNLTLFAGVSGFESALDAGYGGSAGIYEGFNWSAPATPQGLVSAQFGFRALQSEFRGSGIYDKGSRNQYFVSAGIFKRLMDYPLQGGVVYDWYEDDFYGKVKVQQFRCELSVRTFRNFEYGFIGGFGTKSNANDYLRARENLLRGTENVDYSVEADDWYTLFARKHFANSGVGELRAGLTGNGDILVSAGAEFPVNDQLTLNGGFRAIFPEESRKNGGWRKESYDVSVGLVFYFRGGACTKPCNLHRPMFDVAGNGSFIHRIR